MVAQVLTGIQVSFTGKARVRALGLYTAAGAAYLALVHRPDQAAGGF
jgi:hypothetical protein